MSVARTKSRTPGTFPFGKSGTSPCSSFEGTIETSADSTTFARTEGRASSVLPTEKSSGPSFARTTPGPTAWRQNCTVHHNQHHFRIHEAAPLARDDGGGPSPCRLLFRVPPHVLQSTPGLSHGPPTLATESDAHDDRVRLVLRCRCDQTA